MHATKSRYWICEISILAADVFLPTYNELVFVIGQADEIGLGFPQKISDIALGGSLGKRRSLEIIFLV